MSAAREQPLAPEPVKPLQKRVTTGASEAALTGVAVVKELVTDFRGRSRFFQYKAGIIAGWIVLSLLSVAVAWPSGSQRSSDLGARLVLAGDPQHPVWTLFNDSDESWVGVVVVVNKRYESAAAKVASGGNLTLTPGNFVDKAGKAAPADLRLVNLEVHTRDGDDVLMQDGQLVE
jgi:hypothetical protein